MSKSGRFSSNFSSSTFGMGEPGLGFFLGLPRACIGNALAFLVVTFLVTAPCADGFDVDGMGQIAGALEVLRVALGTIWAG